MFRFRKIAPLTFEVADAATAEVLGTVWCVSRSHWLFARPGAPCPRIECGNRALAAVRLAEMAAAETPA